MPKTITAILVALLLAPCLGGCNKPVAQNSANENQSAKPSDNDSAVPQIDIATQPKTLPENDATAKEVCQRFLGLLAQGERSLAEQLLTKKALKTTVDAGLELEAMGGEGSSVEVDDAIYATSRAKVAQVSCTVTEKDGEAQTLSWMMRRGASGWRIAGLIVDPGESQEFLSLENRSDVAAIMNAKGGSAPVAEKAKSEVDTSESDLIRQVSGTDDE